MFYMYRFLLSGNGGNAGNVNIRYRELNGKIKIKSCRGSGAQAAINGVGGRGKWTGTLKCSYDQKVTFLFQSYFENTSSYCFRCQVSSQNSYGKSDYFNCDFRNGLPPLLNSKTAETQS